MKRSILLLIAIIWAGTANAQCNATIAPTSFTAISTTTTMDSAGAHSSGNNLLICAGATLYYDYIYQYKTFYVSNGATLVIKKIQQCDVYLESGATLQIDTVGSGFVAPIISNIHFDSTNVTLIDTNQFIGASSNWVHCIGNAFDFSLFSTAPCTPLSVIDSRLRTTEFNFENPVRDYINLQPDVIDEIATIKLIGISGKTIKSITSVNGPIDVTFLPQGIYFLQLQNREGATVLKKFYKN